MTPIDLGGSVDHIGIAVRSIEKSIGLYGALGLRLLLDRMMDEEGVRVVLMGGDSRVELLEGLGEATTIGRFVERKGEGLHHVAIRVDELDEAIRRSVSAGMETVGEVRRGVDDRRIVFMHPRSTNGSLIELVEGPPMETEDVSRETDQSP